MNKNIVILLLLFIVASCSTSNISLQSGFREGTVLKVLPQDGFHFPYYLRIPENVDQSQMNTLIVQPNNTGKSNDDLGVHEKSVIKDMDGSLRYLAKEMKSPVLMPVFPRPKNIWRTYTHSLDEDTLLIKEGSLRRLDLQLIEMIKHARKLLQEKYSLRISDKVFLNGFSASGTFVNRFTAIHPRIVKAVASGGINAIPILPVLEMQNVPLPYPIGLYVDSLIDGPLPLESYKRVPQFIYMGAKDDNDTLISRDAFSESEASLIKLLLREKMMPDRWNMCIDIYKKNGINAKFKTYSELGHVYNKEIVDDVIAFFKENQK